MLISDKFEARAHPSFGLVSSFSMKGKACIQNAELRVGEQHS